MRRRPHGLTLLELLFGIVLISVIILGIASLDIFSRHHVIDSERRSRLQNELSFALEHMSKNVTQGIGDPVNRPLAQIANGFSIRVDQNNPQTPENPGDDTVVSYTLSGNTLRCSLNNEILSTHILPGLVYGQMPASPSNGFYINFSENYTVVEIGLVARFSPNSSVSVNNPQVEMKSQLYTRITSRN